MLNNLVNNKFKKEFSFLKLKIINNIFYYLSNILNFNIKPQHNLHKKH